MGETTANRPASYACTEFSRRLPQLLGKVGEVGLRSRQHGEIVARPAATTLEWRSVPGHADLEFGVPRGWSDEQVDATSRIITNGLHDLIEIESLSTALVDSYNDIAVVDELGRRLPTCTDAEAAARLLAQVLAARFGGTGVIAVGHEQALPLRGWGGVDAAADFDPADLALTRGRDTPRILDHRPLPPSLRLAATPVVPGSLCAVPLVSTEGDEGCVLLGRAAERPYTSNDAKLLELLAAQIAAYLLSLRQQSQLRRAALLHHEMQLASDIQQSLLPAQALRVDGAEVAGRLTTARMVGGDYFDHLWDGGILTLVVADVSGHNVAAALAMAMVRTALRAGLGLNLPPAELLTALNRQLTPDFLQSRQFVSMAVVAVDPLSGSFTLANAGHPPVLLRSHRGEVTQLVADGPVLGLVEEAEFEEVTGSIDEGGALLLYSDGITETRASEGEFYGTDRLCALLAEPHESAAALVTDVLEKVAIFRGNAPEEDPEDDLTVLAIHREFPPSEEEHATDGP